jgi:hypothetical protein
VPTIVLALGSAETVAAEDGVCVAESSAQWAKPKENIRLPCHVRRTSRLPSAQEPLRANP